ncbi:MAG TPA: CBS domain-containing protein [Acidimicrobiia bacterium]|nr:CBS domain-containing protein [Acidimicrobiia bacterium]
MSAAVPVTPAELELEPVVRIDAHESLSTAARIIVETGVETLLIDGPEPAEITTHDLVAALARRLPADVPVGDIATDKPLFVGRDTPVERILEAMVRFRRRDVIVVDRNGVILGLLALPMVVAVLVDGPSWLGALRIALQIEDPS